MRSLISGWSHILFRILASYCQDDLVTSYSVSGWPSDVIFCVRMIWKLSYLSPQRGRGSDHPGAGGTSAPVRYTVVLRSNGRLAFRWSYSVKMVVLRQRVVQWTDCRVAYKWLYSVMMIVLRTNGWITYRWLYCIQMVVLRTDGRIAYSWLNNVHSWSYSIRMDVCKAYRWLYSVQMVVLLTNGRMAYRWSYSVHMVNGSYSLQMVVYHTDGHIAYIWLYSITDGCTYSVQMVV